MKKSRSQKHLVVIIAVAAVAAAAIILTEKRHDVGRAIERASLPEAVEYEEVKENTSLLTPSASPPYQGGDTRGGESSDEVNLAVPFTVQAPFANWEAPYKEFCEEASALMAAKYLTGEKIPSPESADAGLLAIKAFEEKRFGYYEDTTAAETAVILREYFNIDAVKLLDNPTAEDMKQAVAAGKLVIVPAAGRLLGNPYYTPPGPLYHMLVVKGYTSDGKFITNDPGTRRGADFLYFPETIMNAMHDWRPDGDIEKGRKVVLIVG